MLGQHGHVVGVVTHLQRPGLAEAGRQAGPLGQLSGEGGIPPQRHAAELEEVALGVGGLRDRREHPGRRVRRAAAGIGIGHGNPEAALGRPPGDGQTDDTAADDQDVGRPAAAGWAGRARAVGR